MDQTRTNDAAKEAAEQAGKTATDAAKRLGEQMQPGPGPGQPGVGGRQAVCGPGR
jgi:hypothetical protein